MKTTGNKKGYLDLSEILCNMCKTEGDEVSDDLSDSDAEEDEPTKNKSREFIRLERREIREFKSFREPTQVEADPRRADTKKAMTETWILTFQLLEMNGN